MGGGAHTRPGIRRHPPGLCLVLLHTASLAPGLRGALALCKSLVNGWMNESDGGRGRGGGSGQLGEGRGARWGRGGSHWRESGGGGRREAGRAGRACWARIRLRGGGGGEGPRRLPSAPPAWRATWLLPAHPAPGSSPTNRILGVFSPPGPCAHCIRSGRCFVFLLSHFPATRGSVALWDSNT